MSAPPPELDGAEVLAWAWSGDDTPFGFVGEVPIHGLAIVRYAGAATVYRLSCDRAWQTQQDADYATVEDAQRLLPAQYRRVPAVWTPIEAQ